MRCDQGATLMFVALDVLDELAILLPLGVDWQITPDQSNVAQAKLFRPGRKQPRGSRLTRGDSDECESVGGVRQVASVRAARRAYSR